jgi:hypothetical protein
MPGQRRPPTGPQRPPRKTPAERSVEFDETQRQLKEDAAKRREAAKATESDRPARKR